MEPLGLTGVFNLKPWGCSLSGIGMHVAQYKAQDIKHYELKKKIMNFLSMNSVVRTSES